MDPPSMAGKDPFEAVGRQALHGPELLLPGVPAGAPRCPETLGCGAVGEMVPRKQIPVPEEKAGRARGVAGNGNEKKIGIKPDGLLARKEPFDPPGPDAGIGLMENPLASEMAMEFFMVGHIVRMGQEEEGHAPQGLETIDDGFGETRGIDQDVPSGPFDQVAHGAEAFGGGEAALEHGAVDPLREQGLDRPGLQLVQGSDRGNGTGDEGPKGTIDGGLVLRLAENTGHFPGVIEGPGSHPLADATVDTSGIDKKFPRNI